MNRMIAAVILIALASCQRPQWEVAAENKSDVSCSVRVDFTHTNGTSDASILDLGKKKVTMIAGQVETIVSKVTVTRGKATKELTPNIVLPPGSRLDIVVEANGEVRTIQTGQ